MRSRIKLKIRPPPFVLGLLLCGMFVVQNVWAGLPPVITVQPSDTNAPIGGTASFTVAASSGTTLSYQWYFNSNILNAATASTYTLTNVQPTNAGGYYVAVQNADGT